MGRGRPRNDSPEALERGIDRAIKNAWRKGRIDLVFQGYAQKVQIGKMRADAEQAAQAAPKPSEARFVITYEEGREGEEEAAEAVAPYAAAVRQALGFSRNASRGLPGPQPARYTRTGGQYVPERNADEKLAEDLREGCERRPTDEKFHAAALRIVSILLDKPLDAETETQLERFERESTNENSG